MKYLVVGAGGIGGSLAGTLANAGKDVTLIMRGENLEAVRRDGLHLTAFFDGSRELEERVIDGVKAMSWDEYRSSAEQPDVIFLCTKSYQVEGVAADVNSVAAGDTIIIPLMNGIRMGDYVRRFITAGRPIDGCIYMVGRKTSPGHFAFTTNFMRIVFGAEADPDGSRAISREEAEALAADMNEAGIRTTYSENILRDMLRKFSGVAPTSVAEIIHDCSSGPCGEPGEAMDTFIAAVREVEALGEALGAPSNVDLVEKAVKLVRSFPENSYTSLLVDLRAGRESEFESQILGAIELGERVGVDMKTFKEAALICRTRYLN